MKEISMDQLQNITAGRDIKITVAQLGCIGVGLSFGLINPILGVVANVACSGLVEKYT